MPEHVPWPSWQPGDQFLVTHRQAALCTLHELDRATPGLILAQGFRLPADTDVRALEFALHRLVARHPVLQAVFTRHGATWSRHPNTAGDKQYWSRELAPTGIRNEDVIARLRRFCRTVPALDGGALFRAFLLTGSSISPHLAIAAHHVVVDLWSTGVLATELGALYTERIGGPPAPSVTRAASTGTAHGRRHDRALSYWTARYAEPTPPLRLAEPPGRIEPAADALARDPLHIPLDLGEERSAALKRAAVTHRTTRHTLLFAAQALATSALTGAPRVALVLPQHRRTAETMTEVDYVAANYVVPVEVTGLTVADLVQEAEIRIREARVNQSVDHAELAARHRRDVAYLPEAELSIVVYERTPGAPVDTSPALLGMGAIRSGALTLTPVFSLPSVGPLPVVTALAEHDGVLAGRIEVDPARCAPDLGHRLHAALLEAVDTLIAGPDTPLGSRGRAPMLAEPVARATAAATPPLRVILGKVADTWSRTLSQPDVGPDANFFELGGHSLLVARLAHLFTVEFGLDVPPDELWKRHTVQEQAQYLFDALSDADTKTAAQPALQRTPRRPLETFRSDD